MKRLYEISQDGAAGLIGDDDHRIELSEAEIEELLFRNPDFLGERLLYIGRQISTSTGKRLDLVALDESANILVFELKKGPAPREIIAQVLDYTSWLKTLSERQIELIARTHFEKHGVDYVNLLDAYEKTFGKPLSHRIGSEIIPILLADSFPEDIVNPTAYLNQYGLPIRCVELSFFEGSDGRRFLTVEDVMGEEGPSTPEKGRTGTSPVHKAVHRRVLLELATVLNERYSNWYSSLPHSVEHGFKLYQAKDASWSCLYLDWLVDGNKLTLEVGVYPGGETEKEGHCVHFRFRKKMDPAGFERVMAAARVLLDVHGYVDESAGYAPHVTRYFDGSVEIRDIEKNVHGQMEILKPVLESVMKVYRS